MARSLCQYDSILPASSANIPPPQALILDNLPLLFPLSPTPHRPLVSTLLPLLHRVLITAPSVPIPSSIDGKPSTLAQRAATVIAHLHILAGKVAASPAFHADMLLALAESHTCLSALIDGTLNLPPHHAPQVASASVTYAQTMDTPTRGDVPLGALAREMASEEKIQPFVRALEGWTAVIHSLLAFPTARPVTLPLGGILHLAMRMLSCTPDVPLLEHVQGDAQLVASLRATQPKLWVAGLKLISACTIATGAHVVPYLGLILDHTIHLSEILATTPSLAPQLALFRFHVLVLSQLGTDPSASAYHVRLVKLCIGYVSLLLRQKPVAAAEDITAGKKGKKRMRGAGEDAFIGSLAGRVGQGAVGKDEGRVIVAALKRKYVAGGNERALTLRSAFGALAASCPPPGAPSRGDPSRAFHFVFAGHAKCRSRLGGSRSASDHFPSR